MAQQWRIGTYLRIRPSRKPTAKSYTLSGAVASSQVIADVLYSLGKTPSTIVFPLLPASLDTRSSLKQREIQEFKYSRVFDHDIDQECVFNHVCLDIINSALEGYNGTILAYGQTGSGKTFTITGGESYQERGIIPRTISALFDAFEARQDVSYRCYISYLEIYNESIYDLLDKAHLNQPIDQWTKIHLQLSEDDEDDVHFRNLGVYEANSEEDALNLLFLGNVNRVTSDTPMNMASSRSHSIFTILIESRRENSDIVLHSKLHIVDLAGSERVYKRDGSERMRTEGRCINLSLHHLEQVILALQQRKAKGSKPHVPYRNSMLTSVLRGSLGGNCKSVFIGTLNPEAEYVDESISTCRFLLRCSEVALDIRVNQNLDSDCQIALLLKENNQLKLEKAALEENCAHQVELNAQLQAQLFADKSLQPLTEIERDVCEKLVDRYLTAEVADTDAAKTIQHLGMAHAMECLRLMKNSLVFASNTAAEAQEMLQIQDERLRDLEIRLIEQKNDAEKLKHHVVQLSQHINELETQGIPASEDEGWSESDAESEKVHSAESSPHKPHATPSMIPSAPKGESASDSIKRRMELLKQGGIFIKHGRQGKPHARFVWCSSDLQYLSYRPVGSQSPMIQIPTASLQALVCGQTTKVFQRKGDPLRSEFSFSILYDDSKRSLDLEVDEGESIERNRLKCNEWMEALQFLIKWKSAQRNQPPMKK